MKASLLELAEMAIIKLLGKDLISDLLPHQRSEPRGNYTNFANKVNCLAKAYKRKYPKWKK